MTVRVPAKINLQLSVGASRPDGFHELVTVFCAVSLFDEVTVGFADDTTLRVTGPRAAGVPVGSDNLVLRAVRLIAQETGRSDAGVSVHLHKNIPVAAGMGGGSADAAATLVAVDALWGTGVSAPRLGKFAAQLGSDVTFPLTGAVAVGCGRGELLRPLVTGAAFTWVLAISSEGLSTRSVFAEFDRLRAGVAPAFPSLDGALVAALAAGDAVALGAALSNGLQEASLALRPELRGVLLRGRSAGALGCIVSGSGPTCLFLTDSRNASTVAAAVAEEPAVQSVEVVTGPVSGAAVVGD